MSLRLRLVPSRLSQAPASAVAASLALASVVALIALRGPGCVEDPSAGDDALDAQTWPLRDALGVHDAYHDALDAAARETLRERIVEHALDDHGDDLDPASPWRADGPNPGPWPTAPLRTLGTLDALRQADGRDARLFGVYIQTPEGAVSRACAPEPGDLLDDRGWPDLASGDQAWPNAWRAPSWSDRHDEQPQLEALAPALARWAARCLEQHQGALDAQAPFALGGPQVFQRTPQAPYLLAYWPQRHKLYVHPALLALWSQPADAARASHPNGGGLRTRAQALDPVTDDLAACVEDLQAQCALCDTQEKAEADPASCPAFFPNSTVFEDCRTLGSDLTNGYAAYCAFAIFQARPSVETCVNTDKGGLCDKRNQPVSSIDTLAVAFDVYVSDTTSAACQDAVNVCANPAVYDPPDDETPGGDNGGDTPGQDEPEPKKDCGDRLGCSDMCAGDDPCRADDD